MNYSILLAGEIQSNLQNMGLLNYSCYRSLRRADWAFVLDWRQGLECFIGLASYLGLTSGPTCLFFKPHQISFFLSFKKRG